MYGLGHISIGAASSRRPRVASGSPIRQPPRSPRPFVLALDGLDHELVSQRRLKGLLQAEHGEYPIEPDLCPKGAPLTPVVYASLITGLRPEGHGIRSWFNEEGDIVSRDDIKARTLFDKIKPSIALFVPGFNEDMMPSYLKAACELGFKGYLKHIWRMYKRRRSAMFKAMRWPWRLFMAWFCLADAIGHLCLVKRPHEVQRAYFELDRLARRVKAEIGEAPLLIVSDHGMTISEDGLTGTHTDRGFYSLSRPMGLKPKGVLDLHAKILALLGEGRG